MQILLKISKDLQYYLCNRTKCIFYVLYIYYTVYGQSTSKMTGSNVFLFYKYFYSDSGNYLVCSSTMKTYNLYFSIIYFYVQMLLLRSINGAINIRKYDMNISEHFLKTISHHFCNRLTGTHVVLLAEKSASSFYKILRG